MGKKKESDEIFLGEVQLGPARTLLAYRAAHHGRDFIRTRIWNLHQRLHAWYPTKRGLILPAEHAEEMANVLLASARGTSDEKPDWLIYREVTGEDDPRETKRIRRERGLPPDAR